MALVMPEMALIATKVALMAVKFRLIRNTFRWGVVAFGGGGFGDASGEGRVECIKYKECLVKKKDCKIS